MMDDLPQGGAVTVLILQHVADEGPGRIADALDRAGRAYRTIRLDQGQPFPAGLAGVDGLVVMGGPMGVADVDRYPHLADEQRLIADCLDSAVPVLGVCLGAQLVAATAGAPVSPGDVLELGWHDVTLSPAAHEDALLHGVASPLVALHWHADTFDLPEGAVALASSARTRHQAFRVGEAAYGLLFHLEADHAQVAAMAAAFPEDIARSGEPLERLLDPAPAARIEAVAATVFDRWTALLP